MTDKNNYQFSIVVPVYGSEEYLEACKDSLVHQKNAEVIFVDDGTKDRSNEMCDRYAEQYENVRVFHKENGGTASARNYGMRHAKGQYLLFVDPDDFIEPNTCERLSELIQEYGDVDILAFDAWEENGDKKVRMYKKETYDMKVISGKEYMLNEYKYHKFGVEIWRRMYRRGFMEENGLEYGEGIIHEDMDFTPRVHLKAQRVLDIKEPFYHYIVRENSICTWKDRTKNIIDVFSTLKRNEILARQQEPELSKWMLNGILNTYLSTIYGEKMYQKKYRHLIDKKALRGKASTNYNRMRVLLCMVSVRLYCYANDIYKLHCRK